MYSDEDLNSAVNDGVLQEQDVTAFRNYMQKQRSTQFQDEEHFRLVNGFNDIFVVIAAVLALAALWTLGNIVAPWFGGALVAVASWLLAEYFTRNRHMALPSIVLLLSCLTGVFAGVLVTGLETWGDVAIVPIVACLLTAVVATLHWFRFRVPITLTALAAAGIGSVIMLGMWAFDFSEVATKIITLVSGLAVFSLALSWDRSDRKRQTRRSDVAFWLHLLAAPLIVHPIFVTLAQGDFSVGLTQAGLTIVLYVVLALVSLIIDRRALMVSALSYVIYVFSALLDSVGLVDISTAVIGLVIGSGLLLMSVFWHPLRGALMKFIPQGIAQQLPA
ncbi:hypothetical protein [Pseudidiomarina terrestris]|uniref:DUF2157 domain-containing protein n=1 Tax=Pseudidiomarina terrestris TaxID=2820060 RepID=A0AAW7R1Y3_9GAMM|nr:MULTISPECIES: hypothetical protein [unclassified Pseudidiomarina]MDN7125318.1 hypothetical protein [Pseudidiomarina sp. 1APP75-32.1]MDN7130077.1 hypothetical protein [Pseudidiomarina sp. 1APR75-15]MDN7135582.1 hypothetical protein [Pseudidiomarina sp. 1ASP75-5]MDN7137380.1 hypothetical protein [Pseudidiomarina sp. 1ASP75-14]MEA3589092.1 hypothetical protein [Pseudidiomarina sp. 1APP75-27a]